MLDDLKTAVYEANLSLAAWHLVTLTWGNVSGIDRDQNMVVIKPSGVDYAELKPDDMVVIDLESDRVVEGSLRPSSDTPTHLVLYRAFNTIGGVAHTHSTYATAFAQASRGIPALGTTHADQFHGDVPVTRPMFKREIEANYETNTGNVIVERFAKIDPVGIPGVLVANHGPFTWGPDPLAAAQASLVLESIARMAYLTLQIHPQVLPLSPFLLDKHYQRKHGSDAYYGQTPPA